MHIGHKIVPRGASCESKPKNLKKAEHSNSLPFIGLDLRSVSAVLESKLQSVLVAGVKMHTHNHTLRFFGSLGLLKVQHVFGDVSYFFARPHPATIKKNFKSAPQNRLHIIYYLVFPELEAADWS